MNQTKQDIWAEAARLFGGDTLYLLYSVKRVMIEHKLDYRDKNLQEAFLKVVIAVKKSGMPDRKTFPEDSIKSKISEAKNYLSLFGLPESLLNKMTMLTFLALCNITPVTPWSEASRVNMGLSRDIMKFVSDNYDLAYKSNTRESFRKDGINLLLNYGIIDLNPGNPHLGPNSPLTHYAIKQEIIERLHSL